VGPPLSGDAVHPGVLDPCFFYKDCDLLPEAADLGFQPDSCVDAVGGDATGKRNREVGKPRGRGKESWTASQEATITAYLSAGWRWGVRPQESLNHHTHRGESAHDRSPFVSLVPETTRTGTRNTIRQREDPMNYREVA
jgi:hypothetical protein